jgi:uncharacterized membrane protein YeaQ/YmgE (transglycosylase-associated protein family)
MKLWTSSRWAIPVALLATTSPAWAQGNAESAAPPAAGWIAWILVGLVGGFLASRVINKSGEGFIRDIILGIIGGIIGGIIFRVLGGHGVTGFNLWSILVAFIGAVVLLVIYHAIRGQGRTV